MIRILASLALLPCLSIALATETKNPVDIEEWTVPYEESRPRDPFAVSPEAVWFVGQRTSYLARLNPQTGEFFRHELDDESGPHNLIVGKDGSVWYAGNRKGYIGRYDPASKHIEKIPMPREDAHDPHTLVFDADEKHVWFTLQRSNFIGRLRMADHKIDLIEVPTRSALPYGIKVAPDGSVWVVLFGTHKLASVDPETLELTEHELPDADTRPRRLEITSDGQVYYVDFSRGYLGQFDPERGFVAEWPLPSGPTSRPYGTAMDDQDRVWLVETGLVPNRFVGFNPESRSFFSITPIPSGGGVIRHMHYHAPSDAVWFGTDANTIGRAVIGQE
jgi:virginiamycin B lyase